MVYSFPLYYNKILAICQGVWYNESEEGGEKLTAYIITGVFILFDIITGLIKAWHNKKFDSSVMRQGMFNKLSEVLAVAFSAFLQYGSDKIHLGIDVPVVSVVTAYICVMEFISITENLCDINPHMKKLFGKYLQKAKEKEDK